QASVLLWHHLSRPLPAGLAPAWFRLEDGCRMCSATAAILNWSARQDLHLRSLGPRPRVLAATLRADGPGGPEKPRRGFGFLWRWAASFLGTMPIGRLADSKGGIRNAKCKM